MAPKAAPWLEFDFNDSGVKRKFQVKEDAASFVQQELEFWEWVSRYTHETSLSSVANWAYNSVTHTVNGLNNPHQYGDGQQFLSNQFTNLYNHERLPTKDSADAKFITLLRKNYNDATALGALAYISGRLGGAVTNRDAFRGSVIAFMREQDLSKDFASSSHREINIIIDRANNRAAEASEIFAEHISSQESESKKQKHKFAIQRRWYERRYRRLVDAHVAAHNHEIQKFDSTRKTFEELMRLKAPVDYWRDKSKSHKQEAARYKNILLWHSWWAAPSLLVSLGLLFLASFKFADANKPAAAYLLLVTIGIVLTTMAFWAARIIVRFYMSEHHLAIDAEERATMALTYLALVEKGVVEEKDRALILAPLFRPSTDGIVKDDGAPDLSPASLLSKALNR